LFNYLKNSKYSGIRSQTNYGNSNIKLWFYLPPKNKF
jgi:hypothetical protein